MGCVFDADRGVPRAGDMGKGGWAGRIERIRSTRRVPCDAAPLQCRFDRFLPPNGGMIAVTRTDPTPVAPRKLRSALFVDFDNVYSGLERLDARAMKIFAEDPASWVAALASGIDGDGPFTRRFLVQRCYLNPATFSRYRPNFTRAGFQVVDCPSLTQLGKSSADINLVLDAVDALTASTRFEEFVILSADADFTPLVVRCRAADRLVTIITPGPAAAAYRAVADTVIAADLFIGLLTEPVDPISNDDVAPAASSLAEPRSTEPAGNGRAVGAAAGAVTQLVTTSDHPVRLAVAAQVAQQAEPDLRSTHWAGEGSFTNWLRTYLPALPLDTRAPGHLWDPARFSEADLPHSMANGDRTDFSELQLQVAGTTEIPLVDQTTYRQLIDRLAFDLATAPFSRTETSKRVRDDCVEHGVRVGRAAVNFVINGLLLSGTDLDDSPSAEVLAQVWTDNVIGLCRGARIELSESDVAAITAWVSGGLVAYQSA